MGLTDKEAKLLARLAKKRDEPDAPSASRALNISIDLSDDKAVERAQKLGLFGSHDDEDDDGDDGDGDGSDDGDGDDGDDVPKRRSYFKS